MKFSAETAIKLAMRFDVRIRPSTYHRVNWLRIKEVNGYPTFRACGEFRGQETQHDASPLTPSEILGDWEVEGVAQSLACDEILTHYDNITLSWVGKDKAGRKYFCHWAGDAFWLAVPTSDEEIRQLKQQWIDLRGVLAPPGPKFLVVNCDCGEILLSVKEFNPDWVPEANVSLFLQQEGE